MANEKIEGRVTAFCDGGSRGNPGPAGYGVSVEGSEGQPVAELSEFIGVKTNNVAEYQGLLAALGWAVEHEVRELRVVSDSELMVKQMKGQYSVKSPDLKPLYEEAKRRAAKLGRFEMQHVLRGKNKEADRLANEAMDRGMGRGVSPGVSSGTSSGSVRATARQPLRAQPAEGSAAGRGAGMPPASSAGAGRGAGGVPLSRLAAVGTPGAVGTASPPPELPREVTGFVRNGVVHLVEGELPEGTFVRVLPARR